MAIWEHSSAIVSNVMKMTLWMTTHDHEITIKNLSRLGWGLSKNWFTQCSAFTNQNAFTWDGMRNWTSICTHFDLTRAFPEAASVWAKWIKEWMDGWLTKWRNAALLGPNTIASSAVLSIWRLCHTVILWEPNTAPTQAVQLVPLKGHYLEVTPKQCSLLSLLPPLFTSVVF